MLTKLINIGGRGDSKSLSTKSGKHPRFFLLQNFKKKLQWYPDWTVRAMNLILCEDVPLYCGVKKQNGFYGKSENTGGNLETLPYLIG